MQNTAIIYPFLFLTLFIQNTDASTDTVNLVFENGNKYQFNAVVCRTDEHQVGNLMVKAAISAKGEIDSQKVVLFIDQSHPVGAPSQVFEDLQIWTTDINEAELLANNKNLLSRNLDPELKVWYQEQQIAIQKKYLINNDMTSEQMIEYTDKSSQELDKVHKELLAKQTKMLRSFGKTKVKGSSIAFDSGPAGLEMFTRGGQVKFENLLGVKFSANVNCSQ